MSLSVPEPEVLQDHTGALRPRYSSPLTGDQVHRHTSFHEAGHAVVSMAFGLHLVDTQVYREEQDEDRVFFTGNTQVFVDVVPALRFAVSLAAGDVAEQRHLREQGLLTDEIAGMRAGQDHDQAHAIATLADCGFRIAADHAPRGGMAWAEVVEVAEWVVDLLWTRISTVGEALYAHPDGVLTGDEVAALVHLPNPVRGA